MSDSTFTCIDILVAILLPPLGVFLKYGCKVKTQHPTPPSLSSFDSFALASMQTWVGQFFGISGLESEHIEFWICLLLTILGYLPGIIYAIWIITKH
ncbi:hypothetical protein EUGRSUZ_H01335 [Eucalyptus grandis]|uniref:Uncharacterized protein n=2 Tax=Eucalyptus grandis TaxID=71139 RepID=A0ACC3JPB5_EUCGR|nr:hypothetical protein EUGRSUZ_H01335 [Eucalyptus grandis]